MNVRFILSDEVIEAFEVAAPGIHDVGGVGGLDGAAGMAGPADRLDEVPLMPRARLR